MSKYGDLCVRVCESMRLIPAAILCIIFFILQCAVMDYYMAHYIKDVYLVWITADVINVCLLSVAIIMAFRSINNPADNTEGFSVAWVAWLFSSIALASKVIIIFEDVVQKTDEASGNFFGPNTLKTTIALSSVVFLLLLMTQHNAALGTERRRYIENLTGTVMFDVLDTADILEVLFDTEIREDMWPSLEEAVMGVAAFNLILPTLPLFTLSYTKFGKKKLRMKMLYLHRLALVLLVNFPNLVIRLILWHGMHTGVTPFILKNAILICLVFFEFYEHKREKFWEHKLEAEENESKRSANGGWVSRNSISLDNRLNNSTSIADDNDGNQRVRARDLDNDVDEGFVLGNRVMSFV